MIAIRSGEFNNIMYQLKENVLVRTNTRALVNFLVLGSAVTFLPFFIHVQWLTGPVINAILILTLFLVGIRGALVIALIPSLMALSGGLIPPILAPIVPFIMISNVIFILVIEYFHDKVKNAFNGYFLGVFFGAMLKFLFLFFSTAFIVKLLMKQELAVKVAQMMSWPQFFTAAIGGMLAFMALKWLKRV